VIFHVRYYNAIRRLGDQGIGVKGYGTGGGVEEGILVRGEGEG
jgi:hypothetical protein